VEVRVARSSRCAIGRGARASRPSPHAARGISFVDASETQLMAQNFMTGRWARKSGRTAAPLRAFWRKLPRPLRAVAVSMVRGLSRPSTAGGRVILYLLAYAALWTVSATIWNLGLPIHFDMAEAFALSREPAAGYFKFSPLINWVTAAWFAVMPIAGWSFYLLAFLNAALGMWLVWLAAAFAVDQRRRIAAVALLGLMPIFTFGVALFNHNTFQLSLWPLVALTFLASIERTNLLWSALFGLASALAILGKYYAGLIVLACVLAALLHPQRRSYLSSPRPYLAAAVCALVLAPNLYWLFEHDFISIRLHVVEERTVDGPLTVIAHALSFVGAFIALSFPALLALLLCLRPWRAAMARSLVADWCGTRAAIACIALAPVILPLVLLAPAAILLRSPWNDAAFFFVPLTALSAPRLLVTYRAIAVMVGAAAMVAMSVLALSPVLMIGNFIRVKPENAEPFLPLARFATETWHKHTGRPLEFVSGSDHAAWSLTFYSPDHPKVFPGYSEFLPLAEAERRWNERGVLGICHAMETGCTKMFEAALPRAERVEVTFPVKFLGFNRAAESYVLYLQPATGKRPPG
jgi:Dolichyl-phosphate-mannose-protein mannosyltransferase